jgi:hypothetical protein
VGIGVGETGSDGQPLLECVFWVVHETRIGVAENKAILQNEDDSIDEKDKNT